MDDYYKAMINARIGRTELLFQLAEESAELCLAALKLMRAECLINSPTPVSVEEAKGNLIEEYNDVLLCAEFLGLQSQYVPNNQKLKLLVKRLYGQDLSDGINHYSSGISMEDSAVE